MRPLFHPSLINDPFGDPGLYVDCLFEKRALLFDLGDIRRLAPRKILRLSHVFVSHTHMDHFIGFDWLLRICLGRERNMHLFGPERFLEQVEHKLAAYTWNLVQNYATDFTLHVTEVHLDGQARRATFRCQGAFQREQETVFTISDGLLLDEEMFSVRALTLDHKTPCLAFALQEKSHVNIWKNRLAEKGLATGPWLRELKQAVLRGEPDATLVRVGQGEDGYLPLGELKAHILRIVPGQKIAYVTDVVYHERNAARIVELARDADLLFIESTFLQQDAARAAEKFHLTAHQAGLLARAAGARSVVPFHFSPIYSGQEDLVREELEQAFAAPDRSE
jgi:ribonuclease Z